MHYNVWDEITYPLPNFNISTIEVWGRISNFIPHFTGHMITYPCWDLSKPILVKEAPPRYGCSHKLVIFKLIPRIHILGHNELRLGIDWYTSKILQRHWGNHSIAIGTLKHPWGISKHESHLADNDKTKYNKQNKKCVHIYGIYSMNLCHM